MGDVLSQDEVDALLTGLTGGDIETEGDAPAEDGSFQVYDFTNQDRIVRGRLPTLEMIHERFTRVFRQSISSAMQRIVDVNMMNTETTKFGEFMRGQAIPSSYHIFRLEPLKGTGLVVLEGRLIFQMVHNFFGGKGTSYVKMEGRDFTPIENRLIKTVIEMLLKDYENAWQPVERLELLHTRAETNPQFVTIIPPSDPVWVIEIEVSFEDVSEKMFFCLPHQTLEPMMEKLKASYQSDSLDGTNSWSDRVEASLQKAAIELSVTLGEAELSARDILNLQTGDIIVLNERYDTPLNVYVEDVLKLRGSAGSYRGSKAVYVTDIVRRESDS